MKYNFTNVVREPNSAADWQRGHSIPSVERGTDVTDSWSSPQPLWQDSLQVQLLCLQLRGPWDHRLKSPGKTENIMIEMLYIKWAEHSSG